MSTPFCAESVTAVMKPRLEDRLQNLEYGLLNPPVHYIRDGQRELHWTAVRLWDGRRFVTRSILFEASASKY
jgi:hypothetical protein